LITTLRIFSGGHFGDLNIVDLAGSEKPTQVKLAKNHGETGVDWEERKKEAKQIFDEATSINNTLLTISTSLNILSTAATGSNTSVLRESNVLTFIKVCPFTCVNFSILIN